MFFDENIDRRESVMIDPRLLISRCVHPRERARALRCHRCALAHRLVFHNGQGVPKKAQVPIGIVGMPQPASHEHKTTIDPVSGNIPRRRLLGQIPFRLPAAKLRRHRERKPIRCETAGSRVPNSFSSARCHVPIRTAPLWRRAVGRSRSNHRCSRNRPPKFRPPISRNRDSAADLPLHLLIGMMMETGTLRAHLGRKIRDGFPRRRHGTEHLR